MPVAVPNYRLTTPTTPIQHPSHTEDTLAFLNFVLVWKGPSSDGQPVYDRGKLFLLGHSCSAHMLCSIYLAPRDPGANATLVPSSELLAATRGFVLTEGIYDLDLLLRSFPTYKEWFIANAFGDRESYGEFDVSSYDLRKGGEHLLWLLLHSRDDTLVDVAQGESMYGHLVGKFGAASVKKDWETLRGDHNPLLKTDAYYEAVTRFILSCC